MEAFLPDRSSQPPWCVWVGAAILTEMLWFIFLLPLVPKTRSGLLIEALLPIPLGAYVYLAIRLLYWMADHNWTTSGVRRLAAYGVAVSVGFAFFGLIAVALEIKRGNFGYWR